MNRPQSPNSLKSSRRLSTSWIEECMGLMCAPDPSSVQEGPEDEDESAFTNMAAEMRAFTKQTDAQGEFWEREIKELNRWMM